MAKPPIQRASSTHVEQFLKKSRAIKQFSEQQPRLIFAIDATASRQPTWDSASHLQRQMFDATAAATSLAIQLCYSRGFRDFYASRWLTDSNALARQMSAVQCLGGHTQISRLLRHAMAEHRKVPIRAMVFIGDAVEESPDTLCDLAGQCRLLKLPLFVFHEGNCATVGQTFQTMANLSGGAYARFDANSAQQLADLLGAVAQYATGGRKALEQDSSDSARLLLKQL